MAAIRSVDPSDEIIQGAIDKANTYKQLGNLNAALDELLRVMHSRKGKTKYGPLLRDMMSRIISYSMEDEMMTNKKIPHQLKDAIKSYKDRLKHNVTTLEEAVTSVFTQIIKRLQEHFSAANSKCEAIDANPDEGDIALELLSGMPVAQRARMCCVDAMVKSSSFLLSAVMNKFAFGFVGKMPLLFLAIIDQIVRLAGELMPEEKKSSYDVLSTKRYRIIAPRKLIMLCVKDVLLHPANGGGGYFDHLLFSVLRLDQFVDISREQSERMQETFNNLKIARKSFLDEPERAEKLLSTLTVLMDCCLKCEMWNDAQRLVQAAQTLIKLCSDERKPISARVTAPVYQAMAQVFLITREPTFHAQCRQYHAIALRKVEVSSDEAAQHVARVKEANTLAVIATLCAPEVDEERIGFKRGFDMEFERRKEIAKSLDLPVAPPRSALVGKLRATRLLDTDVVDSDAVELLQTLLTSTTTLPVKVVEYTEAKLAKLAEQYPTAANDWSVYKGLAVQVAVDRYLERAATTQSKILLSAMPPAVREFVESADNDLPILIDQEHDEIVFQSPLNRRIVETYATMLNSAALLHAAKAKAPVAPVVKVSLDEILDDSDRCLAIYDLQRTSKESAADRQSEARKREEEEKKKALAKCVKEEEDRKQKLRDEQLAKYKQEVAVLEARERRKMIVAKLNDKHKGLKLPVQLANKPHDAFLKAVTEALAAFEREQANAKSLDVRRADHFERACREREIPKRAQLAEEMKEQMKKDREVRLKNLLEQHKQAYERRKEARDKLQKFLPFMESYMADERRSQSAAVPATTKRDEQEAMLQQEKARLGQMAEPAAAAPAAAPAAAAATPAAAAAPPASTAAPAAAATSGPSKWTPKPRANPTGPAPSEGSEPTPAPAQAPAPAPAAPTPSAAAAAPSSGAKWQPKTRTSKPPPTD